MKHFHVASNNYVGLMNVGAHPRWRFWGERPLCANWPKWYHPTDSNVEVGTAVRDLCEGAALRVLCPPGGHKP